jgi:hypothetical protein
MTGQTVVIDSGGFFHLYARQPSFSLSESDYGLRLRTDDAHHRLECVAEAWKATLAAHQFRGKFDGGGGSAVRRSNSFQREYRSTISRDLDKIGSP